MEEKLLMQTRAIVPDIYSLKTKLKELTFKRIKSTNIRDAYYCNPKDLNPELHTYEKKGITFRIRIIDNARLHVQQHKAVSKDKKGKPTHDIFKLVTIFKGTKDDLTKAKNLAEQKGFLHKLIEFSKNREIFTNTLTTINLDKMDNNVYILEVHNEIRSKKDYKATKKQQLKILQNLGLTNSNIISDGYTHRKITQKIISNPEVRKNLLKEELQNLIKQLREKELISGEAYRDTGDGWHENPTYEAICNDILVLKNRIMETREELDNLK